MTFLPRWLYDHCYSGPHGTRSGFACGWDHDKGSGKERVPCPPHRSIVDLHLHNGIEAQDVSSRAWVTAPLAAMAPQWRHLAATRAVPKRVCVVAPCMHTTLIVVNKGYGAHTKVFTGQHQCFGMSRASSHCRWIISLPGRADSLPPCPRPHTHPVPVGSDGTPYRI